jgi:hypothetical protein
MAHGAWRMGKADVQKPSGNGLINQQRAQLIALLTMSKNRLTSLKGFDEV